ncbi:hypothetical protein GMRT_13844 [Giardia muris]|uniref:Uncharacterized protein n=1 Tax=Giardia muris TaxID=5742 RepID=A0A4Z1SQW2_GIAMU|nr:hypothetical protein GMRT_13844 [Giardia muris]|eukprot:TNJ27335.1 hypothetical protein GMRT_13844 [Giardia muris]
MGTVRPRTMQSRVDPSLEAKYSDLDTKYRLLANDRKAVHETATSKIAQNKAIIEALTQENRSLKQTLIASNKAQVQRPATMPASTRGQKQQRRNDEHDHLSAACTDGGLQMLRADVNRLKLKLDEARHQYNAKAQLLETREDQLSLVQKEIDRPEPVVEAGMERIRSLENKLDDASIKEREAVAIRNTYSAILGRLKDERVYFSSQINALTAANKAKDADLRQLEVYLQEAIAASSLVANEYGEYQEYCSIDKQSRRAALLRRRQEVEAAMEDEKRLEKLRLESRLHEEAAMKAAAEAAAQMRYDEDSSETEDDLGRSDAVFSRRRAKLEFFRQTAARIRDAYGIADITEFAHKTIAQPETRSRLQAQTVEFSDKLERLNKEIVQFHVLNSDAQFAADNSGSRRAVERVEFAISEEKFKNTSLRQRYQSLLTMLGLIGRGVDHIYDLLFLVNDSSPTSGVRLPQIPIAPDDSADEQERTIEAIQTRLLQIEQKLRVLSSKVQITEIPKEALHITQREHCVAVKDEGDLFAMLEGGPADVGDSSSVEVTREVLIDLPGVKQARDDFDFPTSNQLDVDHITTAERGAIKRRSELFAQRAQQKLQEQNH